MWFMNVLVSKFAVAAKDKTDIYLLKQEKKRNKYLGSHVTKSASFTCHILGILSLNTSNTKISNFEIPIGIQQHVLSFDIPMHDFL